MKPLSTTTTAKPKPIEVYQHSEEADLASSGFLDILKKGKEIVKDKVSTIGNNSIPNIDISNIAHHIFLVSSIVNVNKSLWCDISTTAVDNIKKVVNNKLGFLRNILGQELVDQYVEQETAKMFQC